MDPRGVAAGLIGLMAVVAASIATAEGHDLASLRIMRNAYPRAHFFRALETSAMKPDVTFDTWDRTYSRLMGIQGKVLDEAVTGRYPRVLEFFNRLKKAHPDQIVLLHYDGTSVNPNFMAKELFAGHWLYYNGAPILSDVPAQAGKTGIRVSDTALFKTGLGRRHNLGDDIGLCVLDAQGRPDWSQSEQVRLIGIDASRGTLTVERGLYGTQPLAFGAGRACAAAHCTVGPGYESLQWYYNFSTLCPRDAEGRRCIEALAETLGRRFGADGELKAFDGIEFDVLYDAPPLSGNEMGNERRADCDADGRMDMGRIGGINTYGAGSVEFVRALRDRLGEGRFICADAPTGQRATGLLNGVETEAVFGLNQPDAGRWSDNMNRHRFWNENGRAPVFSYINNLFQAKDSEGLWRNRPLPPNYNRLALAEAALTDSGYAEFFPAPAEDESFLAGVDDELRMGRENQSGWLGRPRGDTMQLARRASDVLKGIGAPPG
ncbi:MAG: hypothetical protein M1457_02600, partial [bacterium]|nr:hypothetical protein [bacterium]